MARVRIAAAQINTVVGDLAGNTSRILEVIGQVEQADVELVVFPELTITGYPPEDLLARPGFVTDNLAALNRIVSASASCAVVVGYVDRTGSGGLLNGAVLCANGEVKRRYAKALLPNYGVFDEQRWFTPGDGTMAPCVVAGVPVGITICEDLWFADGPMARQAQSGARLFVNLNASPYSRGRRAERLGVLGERATETGAVIVYVNQVGGQDELVFDGASMVVDATGRELARAVQFSEDLLIVDLDVEVPAASDRTAPSGAGEPVSTVSRVAGGEMVSPNWPELLDPAAEVYEALVLGTRDYLAKNGFVDAVIGLSGGIDSSLVAAIAVDALGPDHVRGVAMPSRYSSTGSITDAEALAANLGIRCETVPIEELHRSFTGSLTSLLGEEPRGLTDENLQSRLRGVLLMALSNATGAIVLTTGNKSEMATGYSTLYGDSAGGFAVIKDVPKTLVYELCRYRNRIGTSPVIPEDVLTKPPSAELRPDQRDDESLPPYDVLDPLIGGYVEQDRSPADLVADGFRAEDVARVVGLVDRAEYKRRQMPPGVKITTKAFGKDRRMPITNRYRPTTEAAKDADVSSEGRGDLP